MFSHVLKLSKKRGLSGHLILLLFFFFRWNVLFYFVSITPCPVSGDYGEDSGSSHQVFIQFDKPPRPSFLQAKQTQLFSLSYDQCLSSLVSFVVLCCLCFIISISFSYFPSPLISWFNSRSKTLLPGCHEGSF